MPPAAAIRIYSLVCERSADAIRGVSAPVHPRSFRVVEALTNGYEQGAFWFLERHRSDRDEPDGWIDAICPRCGWTDRWYLDHKGNPIVVKEGVPALPMFCPSCNYTSVKATAKSASPPVAPGVAASDVPRSTEMPEAFVQSAAGTFVAMMNNPHVREAIDRVDPGDDEAPDRYAEIFAWAIPSFPLLRGDDVMIVAEHIVRITKVNDEPIAVHPKEVFAYLSRLLGTARGTR